MAQQFKALAALTEDLSSSNSTQVTQLTNTGALDSGSRGNPAPSSGSYEYYIQVQGGGMERWGKKKGLYIESWFKYIHIQHINKIYILYIHIYRLGNTLNLIRVHRNCYSFSQHLAQRWNTNSFSLRSVIFRAPRGKTDTRLKWKFKKKKNSFIHGDCQWI